MKCQIIYARAPAKKNQKRFKAPMLATGLKPNLHKVSPAFQSQVLEQISTCRDIPAGRIPPQKQDLAHSHWDSPGSSRSSRFTSPLPVCSSGQAQDPMGSEQGRRTAWKTYVQPPNDFHCCPHTPQPDSAAQKPEERELFLPQRRGENDK